MAIDDTMQFLRAPVNTICMGMAASMGSFLLAAGRKGKRSALPHARIMMHQPSGGTQGTASDIEIQAREILYLRSKLNELYAKHTGKAVETIEKDMDRDRFLSADEAKEYGLIDHVIAHYKEMDDGTMKCRLARAPAVSHTRARCPTISTCAALSAASRRTRSGSSFPVRRSTFAMSASPSATRSWRRTRSARSPRPSRRSRLRPRSRRCWTST